MLKKKRNRKKRNIFLINVEYERYETYVIKISIRTYISPSKQTQPKREKKSCDIF